MMRPNSRERWRPQWRTSWPALDKADDTSPGWPVHYPLIFWGSFGYGRDQGVLIPVGMLQSRRANESEDDLLAVQITGTAGYDRRAWRAITAACKRTGAEFPRMAGRVQVILYNASSRPASPGHRASDPGSASAEPRFVIERFYANPRGGPARSAV